MFVRIPVIFLCLKVVASPFGLAWCLELAVLVRVEWVLFRLFADGWLLLEVVERNQGVIRIGDVRLGWGWIGEGRVWVVGRVVGLGMAGERLLLADALLVLADLVYVLLTLGLSDLIVPATCVLDMLLGRSLRWGRMRWPLHRKLGVLGCWVCDGVLFCRLVEGLDVLWRWVLVIGGWILLERLHQVRLGKLLIVHVML